MMRARLVPSGPNARFKALRCPAVKPANITEVQVPAACLVCGISSPAAAANSKTPLIRIQPSRVSGPEANVMAGGTTG